MVVYGVTIRVAMLVVVWIIPRIVVSNVMPSHGCENCEVKMFVFVVLALTEETSHNLEHLPSVEVH